MVRIHRTYQSAGDVADEEFCTASGDYSDETAERGWVGHEIGPDVGPEHSDGL
jgi:hypothetical protein